MSLRALLLLVGVGGGLLHLVGKVLDEHTLLVVGKPWPVWMMAAWLLAERRGHPAAEARFAGAVAVGLLWSGVGDVLLDTGPFIGGMLAFALAHVGYIFASLDSRRPALGWLVGFGAWGVALWWGLAPRLGELALPVAGYAAVLVSMMWRATARMEQPGGRIFALGAVVFGISDSLIALRIAKLTFPGLDALIISLYWLGQIGIFRGAALRLKGG